MGEGDTQEHLKQLVDEFVRAVGDQQLDEVLRWMAPDATVFFPVGSDPRRLRGVAAVRAAFSDLFGHSSPQTLKAVDTEVMLLPPDGAFASFHLTGGQRDLGRRTLIFKRHDDWRIVHLHASYVSPI